MSCRLGGVAWLALDPCSQRSEVTPAPGRQALRSRVTPWSPRQSSSCRRVWRSTRTAAGPRRRSATLRSPASVLSPRSTGGGQTRAIVRVPVRITGPPSETPIRSRIRSGSVTSGANAVSEGCAVGRGTDASLRSGLDSAAERGRRGGDHGEGVFLPSPRPSATVPVGSRRARPSPIGYRSPATLAGWC